jgi:hypothetical protein
LTCINDDAARAGVAQPAGGPDWIKLRTPMLLKLRSDFRALLAVSKRRSFVAGVESLPATDNQPCRELQTLIERRRTQTDVRGN